MLTNWKINLMPASNPCPGFHAIRYAPLVLAPTAPNPSLWISLCIRTLYLLATFGSLRPALSQRSTHVHPWWHKRCSERKMTTVRSDRNSRKFKVLKNTAQCTDGRIDGTSMVASGVVPNRRYSAEWAAIPWALGRKPIPQSILLDVYIQRPTDRLPLALYTIQ